MAYSIFKAPALSFFSKDFYRATALEGKGMGLLYLLVAVFVANAMSVTSAYFHLCAAIDDPKFAAIIEKMPDMHFANDKLSINKPCPYYWNFKNPQTGQETQILIDTTGQTKSVPESASALLTAESIQFSSQDETITWASLLSGTSVDLVTATFKPMLQQMAQMILLIGIVPYALLAWFFHVLLVLFYAIVGMVMDPRKLGYKTAVRMSTVAITPTIVLSAVFYLLFAMPVLWPIITIPISLGYLFYGYSSLNKDASAET